MDFEEYTPRERAALIGRTVQITIKEMDTARVVGTSIGVVDVVSWTDETVAISLKSNQSPARWARGRYFADITVFGDTVMSEEDGEVNR